MSDEPAFCLDTEGFYTNQTAYILTGNDLKFLLGFLNSTVSKFYLGKIAYSLSNEAKRWIKQYIEQIPIPPISEKQTHRPSNRRPRKQDTPNE